MKYLIILLIVFCVVGATFAQTSQNDEATRLSAEVVKLFSAKKYKEAVPIAEKVVQLREAALGANHLKTGEALRNLGFVQVANGDKNEAAKTFEKAIAAYQANTDLTKNSQIELAQMLESVGFSKFEDRKFEKAIELYQKAVDLREKAQGTAAPETADTLWSLANIYQVQKDYKNSEKTFRRILENKNKNFGNRDWTIQDAKNRYQCAATRNDNEQEAQTFINSLKSENQDEKQNQPNLDPTLINGGVVNGKAINLAKPPYPSEARSSRASGMVKVQITINEEGKVIFACAVSGNKLLYEASESAAYQSTFKPTTLSGKPVKVTGVLVYNFVP
jgi:tetratricopeptide (TPR) repeat protein